MKTDLFLSCGHCWVFEIWWHIECSTFTASSSRIWNSSTGILSPPLALFVVMLPKVHLTSHSRKSGSRWVITPSWLSRSWRYFLYRRSFMSHISLWDIGSEVKWSEVAQPCPTLCNPMDSSPPGSSVHGILQARILEWVVISFSRGSSRPRDRTQVSRIRGRRFNLWATREASKPFPGTELGFNPSFSIFEDLSVKVWNLPRWWWCFRSHWEQEHRTSWDFFSQ